MVHITSLVLSHFSWVPHKVGLVDSPVGTTLKVNDFEHPATSSLGLSDQVFLQKNQDIKNGITILIINNKDSGLCTFKDLMNCFKVKKHWKQPYLGVGQYL